jgi:hypothetical protein
MRHPEEFTDRIRRTATYIRGRLTRRATEPEPPTEPDEPVEDPKPENMDDPGR